MLVSGTIRGRPLSVCGEIGVMPRTLLVGVTIGPPFDNAYAVEPVGVEMMSPSQRYVTANAPSISVSRSMTRDERNLFTTMSFTANIDLPGS